MEGRSLSRDTTISYGVGCGQECEETMQSRLDHFPKESERIQTALDLTEATGGGGLEPIQSGWPRSEAWPENEELPLLLGKPTGISPSGSASCRRRQFTGSPAYWKS